MCIAAASFKEENWESTHFHNEKSFTGYGLIFISCLSFIKWKKKKKFVPKNTTNPTLL